MAIPNGAGLGGGLSKEQKAAVKEAGAYTPNGAGSYGRYAGQTASTGGPVVTSKPAEVSKPATPTVPTVPTVPAAPAAPKYKPVDAQVIKDVWTGKYGTGEDRKKRLAAAGYNYAEVQKMVNASVAKYNPQMAKSAQSRVPQELTDAWKASEEKIATAEEAVKNATDEVSSGAAWRQLNDAKEERKDIYNQLDSQLLEGHAEVPYFDPRSRNGRKGAIYDKNQYVGSDGKVDTGLTGDLASQIAAKQKEVYHYNQMNDDSPEAQAARAELHQLKAKQDLAKRQNKDWNKAQYASADAARDEAKKKAEEEYNQAIAAINADAEGKYKDPVAKQAAMKQAKNTMSAAIKQANDDRKYSMKSTRRGYRSSKEEIKMTPLGDIAQAITEGELR